MISTLAAEAHVLLLIDDGIDILPSTKKEVAWECYSSKNGSSSNTINPRKLGHKVSFTAKEIE